MHFRMGAPEPPLAECSPCRPKMLQSGREEGQRERERERGEEEEKEMQRIITIGLLVATTEMECHTRCTDVVGVMASPCKDGSIHVPRGVSKCFFWALISPAGLV